MKFLISLILILFVTNAYASGYQVHCSNAEGTTKVSHGHVINTFYATERTWGNNGINDRKVEFPFSNLDIEYSQEVIIENKSDTYCDEDGNGSSSYKVTTSKKVTAKAIDGFLFSKDIIGVSADRKSIEAFIICEDVGGGQHPCQQD